MRINRTFSIPVDLVHDLRKKPNQSETVTRALRKYLDSQGDSSIESASTRQLMAALTARTDCDDTLKKLLLHILAK